jgi:hypothetical protein
MNQGTAETFRSSKDDQFYGHVIAENGDELVRTSEGNEHEVDAYNALVSGAAIISSSAVKRASAELKSDEAASAGDVVTGPEPSPEPATEPREEVLEDDEASYGDEA